jgi:hypothetical protein
VKQAAVTEDLSIGPVLRSLAIPRFFLSIIGTDDEEKLQEILRVQG